MTAAPRYAGGGGGKMRGGRGGRVCMFVYTKCSFYAHMNRVHHTVQEFFEFGNTSEHRLEDILAHCTQLQARKSKKMHSFK